MDVSINGAKVLWSFDNIPLIGTIHITQTLLMSWIILAVISILCIWLGHGLSVEDISRKQAVAELMVTKLVGFVHGNMGENFDRYIPLVGTLFAVSVISNLMGVIGLWSPTADISTELGWALVVFVLITYYKIKSSGILGYLKGYLDPIFLMAPINVISEMATPVSMACRHFGNILSGSVISTLIYAALATASYALFAALGANLLVAALVLVVGIGLILWANNWRKNGVENAKGQPKGRLLKPCGIVFTVLGGLALLCRLPVIGAVPWLDIGIPAVASFYFDWFSGCIQAFIFCTLTTIFIKQAAGDD